MSQYRIIIICQRTINVITRAQEGASMITKQETKKNKMASENLENYIWIYAHANDLEQGVIL